MEISSVQPQAAAAASLKTTNEAEQSAPEPQEVKPETKRPAREAYSVSLSEEAKTEAQDAERSQPAEETQETPAQQNIEQTYTNEGRIA